MQPHNQKRREKMKIMILALAGIMMIVSCQSQSDKIALLGSIESEILSYAVSHDGRHFAYLTGSPQNVFVVSDGSPGPRYTFGSMGTLCLT